MLLHRHLQADATPPAMPPHGGPLGFAAAQMASTYRSTAAQTASAYHDTIGAGLEKVRTEGVQVLFSRVSANMMLYSATRLGLYEDLKKRWSRDQEGTAPVVTKVGAALVAGGIGTAAVNAAVRLQKDGRLLNLAHTGLGDALSTTASQLMKVQRPDYTGVANALRKLVRGEATRVLWSRSSLTVQRAMFVSGLQLAAYDQAKESFAHQHLLPTNAVATHVAAGCVAGFVTAIISNPIDVIRTRFMNMKANPGTPVYSGALDCALKTMRAKGPLALYKGLLPTMMRQVPFSVLLFVTLEEARHLLTLSIANV